MYWKIQNGLAAVSDKSHFLPVSPPLCNKPHQQIHLHIAQISSNGKHDIKLNGNEYAGGRTIICYHWACQNQLFFFPLCSLIVELRDKRYGCLKHTVQNDKYWQNQEIKTIIKTIKPTEPPQLFLGKDWKNIPFLSIHYWPQTKTLGWRDLWCTWSKATPIQAAVLSQLRLGLVSLQRKANLWQQRRTTEVQKFLLQIKGFLHAAVKVMERPYKLDSVRKIPSTMCLSPHLPQAF